MKKINLDGSEKKVSKTFRIEESIYNEFKEKLKKDDNNIGVTIGNFIRREIIKYNQKK